MNSKTLNVASLEGCMILKGSEGSGGGGGAIINNQEKSVDITENGVTEVTADAGFTGLSKVVVNTNVASSGGCGSDMPVIGDGKTYLYITIPDDAHSAMDLYFTQTVANGVAIDWGDGSAPESLSGTGNKNCTHEYSAAGDYVVSLDPAEGCTLGLGRSSSSYCIMGTVSDSRTVNINVLKAAEIGKNVIGVNKYAFKGCSALKSVVISEGATSIGDYAFDGCNSLSSVVIPEGVTSIGSYAFNNCSGLFVLTIPKGVRSIGNNAFYYCSGLSSIEIPDSVTSIGNSAFEMCQSLKSVVIPDGVTSIGTNAFRNCWRISSIEIPDSVTSIGKYAFHTCRILSSVVISKGATSTGDYAFDSCKVLSSVVIPEGVTSIGNYAFQNCHSLSSVVIPGSVTSIGSVAFSKCYGLALCDFSNSQSVPTLGNSAYASSTLCKIVVPDALYDEWIAATNWSELASQIIKKSDWDAQS